MADPSFDYNTGQIYLTDGYSSNLTIKGTITRTAKNKVKITAKVHSKYRMEISYIYFHFACGPSTASTKFKGSYSSGITTSGYEELTKIRTDGRGGIQTDIFVSNGNNKWITICSEKTFTIPDSLADKALHFAFWFTAPQYYHVTKGHMVSNVCGGKIVSNVLNRYYSPPSGLKLSVNSKTTSSVKIDVTWTKGANTSNERVVLSINDSNNTKKTVKTRGSTVTFTNLKGNVMYTVKGYLYDNTSGSKDNDTVYPITKINAPNKIISTSYTNSIKVRATSYNGPSRDLGYQYQYKLKSETTWSSWTKTIPSGTSYTISNLTSNTQYNIRARAVRSEESPLTSSTYTVTTWTSPVAKLSLELLKGSEHNTIVATAGAVGSNQFAKYIFRIDSNGFDDNDYNKDIPNPMKFTNLPGHTTHTIAVKMKNTVSGLESAEVSGTIETWYDPIYSLSVDLVNNWYWFLSIKALFNYQGGPENIKSYEFGIFKDQNNNVLTNTGKTNSYSKGSTTPGQPDNLDYNTNYNCIIRLTDNHDRTYTVNRVFKTLDARPLYLNGKLQELRLIKPGNITDFITPNLLNVNLPNGKSINMNLMINGDPRTEYE